MAQYHPCCRAYDYPPPDRPITRNDYEDAPALAPKYGLTRLDRRTH